MTNAEDDQWANPGGQFDVLQGRRAGLQAATASPGRWWRRRCRPEGQLAAERLGYFIRAGQALDDAGRLEGVPGIWRQVAEVNRPQKRSGPADKPPGRSFSHPPVGSGYSFFFEKTVTTFLPSTS